MKRIAGMIPMALLLLAAIPRIAPGQDGDELRVQQPPAGAIWVESIDLSKMTQRRGLPRAGRSIRDLPISLGGLTYPHGIGTRSISEFVIDLHGEALRFESLVGLDDIVKTGVGTVTARWSDLGLRGRQPVRDLWQRKDLGAFSDTFSATVPRHGVVFVKIGQPHRARAL
jgi:hypothetical protein